MPDAAPGRPANVRSLLLAAAIGTLALLVVATFAFLRPTVRPAVQRVHYTQQVSFGYHAAAPVGPVYPTGSVTTGDPIFTQLVHRLGVDVTYRLQSSAAVAARGTAQVRIVLAGPTGWRRTIAVGPRLRFTGNRVTAHATLDLPAIEALLNQVEQLTGVTGGGYAVDVTDAVHVHGSLGGRPLIATFSPMLAFDFDGTQLQPGGGPAGSPVSPGSTAAPTTSGGGLQPSERGEVTGSSLVPSTAGIGSVAVSIATLRVIGGIGFLVGLLATLGLGILTVRAQAFAESARIQAQYGHLIVPIAAGPDLGWPAIDVASMKALVRLAECSGQLILHNHDDEVDTYLVNDEGSVYRYQVKLPKVVWGEWSVPSADVAAAGEALDDAVERARQSAHSDEPVA